MKLCTYNNSTVHCNQISSSTKTYNSYMYGRNNSYILEENDNYLDNSYGGAKFREHPHIGLAPVSKLRNILSDTISNLTKNNTLQKGDSVELTLEIELMRTENNSPTNSLVEVTIIQHNKIEEKITDNYVSNTVPLQLETKSSVSESASQKRRNWFHRVITRQNDEFSKDNFNTHPFNNNRKWGKRTSPTLYLEERTRQTEKNVHSKHPRSNFVTILPEEITTISGDYTKGYRRVSPNKKSPISVKKPSRRQRNIMTASCKDSLVKKLSDMFLPSKKADKNEAVKTALNALKNEVDNMKLISEQNKLEINGRKRKRAPVHNLGKLVSNILVDMMEHDGNSKYDEIKDVTFPVQYQSFFEPIIKTNSKNPKKKINERKLNLSWKKVGESRSDTCVQPKKTHSGPVLKSSNSMSDCRTNKDLKIPSETLNGSNFKQTFPKKRNKIGNNKHTKYPSKYTKNNIQNNLNNKNSNKTLKSRNNDKNKISKKNSVIQWNGQTMEVNKDLKTRIEMLIVNELQNLALKEGMECNVMPLPPMNEDTKENISAEKVSSFMCELDISDVKLEKIIEDKDFLDEIIEGKVYSFKSPAVNTQKPILKCKRSKKHILEKESAKRNITKGVKITPMASSDCNKTVHENDIPYSTDKNSIEQNDIEVTYLNKNIQNWSGESKTVIFKSPLTNHQPLKSMTVKEVQVFKFSGLQRDSYIVPSSFVKRIASNDCTWNNYLSEEERKSNDKCSRQPISKHLLALDGRTTSMKFNSATSNECESTIEIELDIKDLELILQKAKKKETTDKILITAKCKHEMKTQSKPINFTGKNSPSYTNQLLSNAARKLEKYVKIKQ